MKPRSFIVIILFLCWLSPCMAADLPADSLVALSGTIKAKGNRKPIPEVNISVPGSNIATVTNADGFFSIKVPKCMAGADLKAERLGYRTIMISPESLTGKEHPVVLMEQEALILPEVAIYGAEPRSLVEQALMKVPQNYSSSRNLFSAFYRETIQKGRRYIGVTEAMVDVAKKPYRHRRVDGERVRVVKGRRLLSQHGGDTIAVKIQGGPTLPVILDVVKNPDMLFDISELGYYDFAMEPMAMIDDRWQYVVAFKPRVEVDYALNIGKLYIDLETTSITRAEFSLDVSDREKATKAVLRKKPAGLRFKPQEIDFVVAYKYIDGVSYLSYINTRTRFKCDWKRRLFSSAYTANAEMVMVDREEAAEASIARKEAFSSGQMLCDIVDNFNDADFWSDYNIIEPTESLEKAVSKLKKR